MDGYSWVLPEQGLANDMETGRAQALSERPDGLARAKRNLSVSDAILERNLIGHGIQSALTSSGTASNRSATSP